MVKPYPLTGVQDFNHTLSLVYRVSWMRGYGETLYTNERVWWDPVHRLEGIIKPCTPVRGSGETLYTSERVWCNPVHQWDGMVKPCTVMRGYCETMNTIWKRERMESGMRKRGRKVRGFGGEKEYAKVSLLEWHCFSYVQGEYPDDL